MTMRNQRTIPVDWIMGSAMFARGSVVSDVGTFDERFKCVVPVCSVGNYQAYLGAACCMCEVVPGALTVVKTRSKSSFGSEEPTSSQPPGSKLSARRGNNA